MHLMHLNAHAPFAGCAGLLRVFLGLLQRHKGCGIFGPVEPAGDFSIGAVALLASPSATAFKTMDTPARPQSAPAANAAPSASAPSDAIQHPVTAASAVMLSDAGFRCGTAAAKTGAPTRAAVAGAAAGGPAGGGCLEAPLTPPLPPLLLQLVAADSGGWSDAESRSPSALWDEAEAWVAEGRSDGILRPRSPTPDSGALLFPGLGPLSPPEHSLAAGSAGAASGVSGESGGPALKAWAPKALSHCVRGSGSATAPPADAAPAGGRGWLRRDVEASSAATNDDGRAPLVTASARTKHRRTKPPMWPSAHSRAGSLTPNRASRPMPPIREDESSASSEQSAT